MKKTLLLLMLGIGISTNAVFAQSQKVKGRVLNEQGEGVPGASVKIKGTDMGTVTDIDGNYEIALPDGGDKKTLIVTSLQDGNKEIVVNNPSETLDVKLDKGNAQELGDVTIYGQTKTKQESVSAISTVSAEQIAQRPVTSVVSALEGNTPGLNITSGGGQPGSSPDLMVRGFGSLSASSSPLIVVDGSVFDGSLVSINPNDVASMNVLKDASATSIYGARGANGVIMITTKKGKRSDKPTINIDASVGVFNRMIPEYDRVGIKDYYEIAWHAAYNYVAPILGEEQGRTFANTRMIDFFLGGYNAYNVPKNQVVTDGTVNPNASLLYNDYDWQKAIQRTGLRQKYNVSVSNGDGKSDYYFSVGYNNEKGIFKQSDYDRITTRLNVNSQITPWLKTGVSLGVTYDDQRFFALSGSAYANPFFTTRFMGPIYPIYLHDTSGNLVTDSKGQPLYDFGDNPQYGQSRPYAKNQNILASFYNDQNNVRAFSGFGNGYMEAKFLKDFKLRGNISLNTYNGNSNIYQNKFFGDGEPFNGILTNTLTNRISYTFNQLLTWKPSFIPVDHSLEVTIGHENYLLKNEQNYLTRAGFGPQALTAGDVAAYSTGSGSSTDYHAIESYLSQASYSYKEKYLFNASFRRDGTSRFGPSVRWGNFWSVGGGWAINRESFMQDVSWVNELKLRASYGISGNEALGSGTSYYSYLPLFAYNPNNTNPGYVFNTYGNPNLKWEEQYSFNVGVDYSIFNNRLSGSIDYYIRGSKDLLFVRALAPSTGIGAVRENIGAMKNTGIELSLHGSPVVSRGANGFSWTVDATLWRNRNKITQVQSDKDTLYQGNSILAKGAPVNNFFMPQYAGVDPATGAERWYVKYERNANGTFTELPEGSTTTDYNEASLVQNSVYAGTPFRDLEGSLTNTFRYKGFDLSFMVVFGIGGKFYDNIYAQLMDGGFSGQGNAYSTDMLNYWKNPGDATDVPAPNFGTRVGRLSTRFLVSNSFLNLKNLNLGYTFSEKMMKPAGFRSLRVYVSAENLYVFTARKGMDVQQNFVGSSDYVYPPYRTFMFGLQLGL